MKKKHRVLIVDDSATVRQTLTSIINASPDLEVMGTASDPFVAAARIQEEIPDVIILDVEMPRMDGITFLRKIMAQRPIPVVMCSSLTEEGSQTLLQAMEAGAIDIISKPRIDTKLFLQEASVRIHDVVSAAAEAKMGRATRKEIVRPLTVQPKLSADVIIAKPSPREVTPLMTDAVVCVGASTGGTEALLEFLTALPEDCPGIVVVQHMPEKFTAAFARRLDSLCRITVKEAEDGDAVMRGQALIAPGSHHMLLQRRGARYHVTIKDGPLVSRHRPSVDVLFRSAARYAGSNAIGVIMTGMGDDGAEGLLEMRKAGAFTIAQDEESCVVFGMPKEAIQRGAVDRIVSLERIAPEILHVRSHV